MYEYADGKWTKIENFLLTDGVEEYDELLRLAHFHRTKQYGADREFRLVVYERAPVKREKGPDYSWLVEIVSPAGRSTLAALRAFPDMLAFLKEYMPVIRDCNEVE
jgi:hypothetical protein